MCVQRRKGVIFLKITHKLIAISFLLFVSASIFFHAPEKQVLRYFHANYEELNQQAEAYMAGAPLSWNENQIQSVNAWLGQHEMIEYILPTPGGSYHGFYYSPDDVPLAFQNIDTPLTQTEPNCWTWHTEGDNRGKTTKIKDHWYLFQATF